MAGARARLDRRPLKIALPPLELARWLLAAVMVALLFSPPVTSLLEISLYALMLGSADLRARLLRAARHPLGVSALAFWGVIALGMTYSVAPWQEAFGTWFSWRRLLLFLTGFALFEAEVSKARIVWVLVGVTALCAIASYVGALFDLPFRHYPAGILLRSHATQGMVFSVAAFAAVVLLRDQSNLRSTTRVLIATIVALLVINVVFITTSRSGHAVLAILAAVLAYSWLPAAAPAKRVGWAFGAAVLAAAVLASSPIVRHRVALGLSEVQNPISDKAIVSSMGERVIYMRNALSLIAQRPILGHGTGAFATAYGRLVDGRPGFEGLKTHDPHNQYLNIAAQNGLLGLIAFLVLLGFLTAQRGSHPYRLLALGVLLAWSASSLFSSHFSTFAEGRFIWLWLGVCLARD